jgi:multidrug efflux system membrane fusion protein
MSSIVSSPWRGGARLTTAAVLALLVACSKQAPVEKPPPVPVTVAAVTRGPAPDAIGANGTVEPLQTASVAAQVSGLVTEVAFREGEMVRHGQVLLRIDPRPYAAALAQAEAALARDQAQAASARRDADRYAALVKDDYVTKSQAEAQTATAAALAATVTADRAAIEKARFDLENTVIRAPISGRTGRLLVHEGNLVQGSPAQPLVVINQLDPILVRFELPASAFPDVQRYSGARALSVSVIPVDSAATVRGRLTFIDNAIDTTTRTVELKGEFANGRGQLWPGQLVQVSLQLDVQQDALLIPAAAVETGQQGSYVFVVGSDGRATMRPITPGRSVGDDVVVVISGLTVGERVVIDGQSRLGTGTAVRIAATQPTRLAGGTP